MKRIVPALSSCVVLCACALSVSRAEDPPGDRRLAELKSVRKALTPLATKLAKPKPGEWLFEHTERGQTFAQYLRARPVTPRGKRNVLYVQPIGPFTKAQRKIVKLSADYMAIYFGLKVKLQPDLPLTVIPKSARRVHPDWGTKQILSTYVLDKVLKPRLAKDAAALIAFTAVDLYPEPSWNFVFGQASLRHRVGVWSIYRNGNANKGAAEFRLCLLRTLKTATHETGHMFTVQHCTAWACNMGGSNSLEESDRQPLALCPECLPKILWGCGLDAKERFAKLIAFCKKHGLAEQQAAFERSLAALIV